MNTLKNRLLGAALIAFGMMSFTMIPIDPDPVDDISIIADKGEWVPSGDVKIDGVWYWQWTCVAGTSDNCIVGSTKHKAKKKNDIMPAEFPL